ncbi:MAG TPA: transcriptional repressor LexA [Armatimonadota bacterium]|nr:transcriptional repressor LexA [Armatimonadota bacterium]
MAKEITLRQKKVLDIVQGSLRERGIAPTVREIGTAIGARSSCTVFKHLEALERKGYIKKDRYKYRSISVVGMDLPMRPGDFISVPLVGQVAAGTPILADENIEQYYPLPKMLVGDDEIFMLEIKGDSMIDAGIHERDLVVVRSQPTANDGEIVVARLGEEATVKRFFREKDRIRLQPENTTMEPIYTREAEILGRVVLAIKRF